ncbi:hypothetical protein ACFL5O_00320 [Myxococcota bacterium]
MQTRASKRDMLQGVRQLVREALEMRERGTSFPKLAHVQGMIDGSMRVLLEAGIASRAELLALVAKERERRQGPAIAVLEPDQLAVA